ncbi:MAG: Gfo/Idh/MocA family oxidoreductase [Thermoanaerobaculia bacterium]|nr:Gfo/Idh/MocA family oxidoreductase [Thermoanaerobaculia bacterium]
MKKLKIGLFGAGHLGKIHLKCILATEQWELAGFYDPDDRNAQSAVTQFSAQRFGTVNELLKAVDAVDIVTPTPSHYALAARAIRAGKHVFLEKPITQTLRQGRELLRLAALHGVKVQAGHVERFNPAFQALHNIQLRPMFIESHRLAAFQPRGTEVSVILDLMIHDIDLVLHLVQSPVRRVSASGVAVLSHTPDIANARVEFDNGCVANLTASRISLKQMRKMRLFQRDAYISLDFLEKQAQIVRLFDQDAPALPPQDQLMEFETPAAGKKWLYLHMPETQPVNAIQQELESFADSITTGSSPIVPLEDGYEALRLAQRILKEIEKRQAKSLEKVAF